MITCQICKTENNHLASVCIKCGGFLQTKVDNINLFETLWKLIEHPSKAFKCIAMSKHKNYIVLLSFLSGINLSFLLLRYWNIYDHIETTKTLFIAGAGGGILVGVVSITIISLLISNLTKFFKVRTLFRNVWSVVSFSFVPLIYSLVFLLPVKLLTFGINYFNSDHSFVSLNQSVHYILLTLDYLMLLWVAALLTVAVKSLYDLTIPKSLIICLPILLFVAAGVYFSKVLIYG
jgi:hypothetical protein